MARQFEVAVIGCGVIGASALYWLSRELGDKVIAFERFPIGHDRGASGDHSRLIRLSYHAPEYTALTPLTYDAWSEIEQESGVNLVHITGGLDIAPPDRTSLLDQYADAMNAVGINYEEWNGIETMNRFPQFRLESSSRVLFQESGGLLDPRSAVHASVALARNRGAGVLDQTAVINVEPRDGHVLISTEAGEFEVGQVVVAADAWTNELLSGFGTAVPLTITEEQVTYFSTPHIRKFARDRFPIWIWNDTESFYGVPVYGEVAVKAGLDLGGDVVTTETRTFQPNPRPNQKLREFLHAHIPDALGPELRTSTCLYTMPPDRDFVIDRLPGQPQVLVLQGAAHGAKFASLIGKVAADLVVRDATDVPIAPFRWNRPAIVDPNYEVNLKI